MTSNFKSDKGVTMETCDENRDDQRFKFVRPINDKDYDVFTTWDGKVIELQNKKDKIGSKFVTVYKKDKHSGEGIKWVEAEDRTFRFYSYQTDNCLTTDKEINSLILKSCKDNDYHQMFKIIQRHFEVKKMKVKVDMIPSLIKKNQTNEIVKKDQKTQEEVDQIKWCDGLHLKYSN